MLKSLTRVVSVVVVGGAVAWWARLKAHGKVPPPEGRWREVTEDDLS
ncbi:MAG TPA: hypothetical protein VIG64_11045 [Actinomycetota bacterium]|jgi:hypothetical protein